MTDLSTHLAKLDAHLARFRDGGIRNLIGGQDVAGKEWFETRSPVDESLIARVALGTAETVDQAARAAFPAWAAMPGDKRRAILHRIADLIEARAEEIALCECWDTGQVWRFMSKAALRGAENFRFFADLAPAARDGKSLPTKDHLNVTSRHPIGPVGVITPWNTPFMLSTWKIAPALAAGCTVVHKPAEFSPLTARLLAEICHEAGLPSATVLVCVHAPLKIAVVLCERMAPSNADRSLAALGAYFLQDRDPDAAQRILELLPEDHPARRICADEDELLPASMLDGLGNVKRQRWVHKWLRNRIAKA